MERSRAYERRQIKKDIKYTDKTGNYDAELFTDSSDTEAEVIKRETLDEIYSIIDSELSAAERTIINSFFFDDKSVRTVAQELGITEENCRKKKERALNKIRAILDKRNK